MGKPVSLGLRFGALLAALVMSGGQNVRAAAHGPPANAGQQNPSGLDLALPAATSNPAFVSRVLPMTWAVSRRQELAGLFDAGFRDPQRRSETCQHLSKIRPPDTAALLYRQYRLQMLTGIIIPHRPAPDSYSPDSTGGPGDDSLNIYLLCLQDTPY